jgi:excisionase family DNA binding protein
MIRPAEKQLLSMTPSTPPFLISEEVCALFRCSAKTLQRMRKAHRIPFVWRGGRFLYPTAEIHRYLNDRTQQAA